MELLNNTESITNSALLPAMHDMCILLSTAMKGCTAWLGWGRGGGCSLRWTSQASSPGTCWRLMNFSFQLMINFYMKWKRKKSFIILVILYWPFLHLAPSTHNTQKQSQHRHIFRVYITWSWHRILEQQHSESDRRWDYWRTVTLQCIFESLVYLFGWSPEVIHFPVPLTFPS